MFAVGFARIISAINFFDNGSDVANLTAGLYGGSLWAWGVWDLCVAALALFGALSLLGNGGFGRIVAYIWAVVLIVNSFMIIGQAPWYAAISIAIGAMVVFGLAASPIQSEV